MKFQFTRLILFNYIIVRVYVCQLFNYIRRDALESHETNSLKYVVHDVRLRKYSVVIIDTI